jgi:hypothetical protein
MSDNDTQDDPTSETEYDEAIDESFGAFGNYKGVLDSYARCCYAWNEANPKSEHLKDMREVSEYVRVSHQLLIFQKLEGKSQKCKMKNEQNAYAKENNKTKYCKIVC